MLELEDVLISLVVDSFSLSKVRALVFIKLCWIISFSLAFAKVSESSGSETLDDITVFTILAVLTSLGAAMVTGRIDKKRKRWVELFFLQTWVCYSARPWAAVSSVAMK